MCINYITISITAGQTVTTSNITECERKPAGKSPSECPRYKEIQAASSRKKNGLPEWSKKAPGEAK
ncbi:uncharacterized protein BDCG_06189 [Blastomyces dermatitidis ER-3]|uniref:Uncharacterized protein n=3 Tax=Blastomyces TaxID=229219 RepID=A0A179UAB5_BLAGS|nr:uncharacterized protein BDBG_16207 [Blastomyces gilchristii SLH14081]XP_045277675.1 uncharacterized protein BDCG_06189 [Blastomyces dermatitidis ER-3]EQL36163.1 hypothetical protein BDFG_02404 [Blastomyces dermatitidis ATCC 26199]KMW69350.1 hypothetical protein BDDG_13505 [Blastomyces dermatitidis ATCC 18188]EEQ91069.2 hypothetical protein BDCG_06189 [Blastomyces dermatitidis ER-3]KMW69351.1 hypothetical protein, variant [Blastomyces dermatitidis ATCC 18188]OAT04239.1 hypothetical protein 